MAYSAFIVCHQIAVLQHENTKRNRQDSKAALIALFCTYKKDTDKPQKIQ